MRPRLRAAGYGLRRAVRGLGHRPWTTALAVGAIAVALLLVSAVQLVNQNLARATSRLGDGVQMIVYLEGDVPRERADDISDALAQLPAVRAIEYVSPSTAAARLRTALGEDAPLLAAHEVDMMPASIEVTLASGVRDVARIAPVRTKLQSLPDVESVEILDDWAINMTELLDALRLAALVLALIAIAACLYIVTATVQLGLQRRQHEMKVYRLVGASGGFVRGPIMLEGMLQGALGALLAGGMLWLLYAAGGRPLARALDHAVGNVGIQFLSVAEVGLLVTLGAGLGAVGGWLATRRGARALA